MKKYILVLVFFQSIIYSLSAQEEVTKFSASASYAIIKINNYGRIIQGPSLGIAHQLNKKWSVEVEALFFNYGKYDSVYNNEWGYVHSLESHFYRNYQFGFVYRLQVFNPLALDLGLSSGLLNEINNQIIKDVNSLEVTNAFMKPVINHVSLGIKMGFELGITKKIHGSLVLNSLVYNNLKNRINIFKLGIIYRLK